MVAKNRNPPNGDPFATLVLDETFVDSALVREPSAAERAAMRAAGPGGGSVWSSPWSYSWVRPGSATGFYRGPASARWRALLVASVVLAAAAVAVVGAHGGR